MLAIARAVLSGVAILPLLVVVSATVQAAEPFDLKSLPQADGATEVFVVGESLLYMSPATVDATGKALREKLTTEGWLLFDMGGGAYESQTADSYTQQDFIKGPHAFSVYVSSAPAKNNRTSVQYDTYHIAEPLPQPKDATELGFDIRNAHLECLSAQTIPALFEFYRTELATLGWTRWTPHGEATGKKESGSIRTHFIKENKDPLLLILAPKEGNTRTIVYLNGVAHDEMMAEYAPKKAPEPAAVPQEKPADAPKAAENEAEEDTDKKFADLVEGLVKEAMKPVTKPKKAEVAAADLAVTELALLAGSSAPIPVPETATEIEHDTEDGTIEFESQSNVKSLAEFYRSQMKSLGWKEKRSVINSESMAVLNFSKGKKDDLSFAIMKMGNRVDVDGRGDILKAEAAVAAAPPEDVSPGVPPPASEPPAAEPPPAEAPSDATTELTAKDLAVEDKAGLPIPKPHSYSGNMKSKFQYAAMASVAASIDTVVAFYRQELTKRGWSEDNSAAKISGKAAELRFTTKEGPAILKLARPNSETTVELTVRQTELAKASGLMPKAGQVKIMFGNILDDGSEIIFNGTPFKVKAGERAEDPKGPSIELPAGKYKFVVKSKGQQPQGDEAVFGADEIWGVLIGPGGGLPLY